jgi:hypothetical protein
MTIEVRGRNRSILFTMIRVLPIPDGKAGRDVPQILREAISRTGVSRYPGSYHQRAGHRVAVEKGLAAHTLHDNATSTRQRPV